MKQPFSFDELLLFLRVPEWIEVEILTLISRIVTTYAVTI